MHQPRVEYREECPCDMNVTTGGGSSQMKDMRLTVGISVDVNAAESPDLTLDEARAWVRASVERIQAENRAGNF